MMTALMIRFAWFPDARHVPEWGGRLVEVFRLHEREISSDGRQMALTSQEVLSVLALDLHQAGFIIERRRLDRDSGGLSALVRDQFDVFHPQWLCCLAIEAGPRGPEPGADGALVDPLLVADIDTLCLALPNVVAIPADDEHREVADYDSACALARTLYGRIRVKLPYRLLLIGY